MFFQVTPLAPNSFEIVATGRRSVSREKLEKAWRAKAEMVAKGRRYKASPLVVHDGEYVPYGGWPVQSRTLSGTITPLD